MDPRELPTAAIADTSTHGPYLVFSWTGGGTLVPLEAGRAYRIGRASENEICIDVPELSRHHAVVRLSSSGEPTIEDLRSTHGIVVKDERVARSTTVRLISGTLYHLGLVKMVFNGGENRTKERLFATRNEPLRKIERELEEVAATDLPLLLHGEMGSGKTIYAAFAHAHSKRSERPWRVVDARTLEEGGLQRALLGDGLHEGHLHSESTVFIEEILAAPVSLQEALASYLEAQEQGRTNSHVGARLLASTSRIPEGGKEPAVSRRLLDLFGHCRFALPTLSQRPEDIVPLFEFFLDQLAERNGQPSKSVASSAAEELRKYPWPGNVRELRQIATLASALATAPSIVASDLRFPTVPFAEGHDPNETEAARIRRALEACGGNQTRAAVLLGISRRTLVSRLNEYEIRRPRR
jgi:DNA-binding NtrC family response regulator